MEIELTPEGGIAMLQSDEVDLRPFGTQEVSRASMVEFDNATQEWTVTSARTGKILARAQTRRAALAWEHLYFSPSGPGWKELKQQGR